MKRPKARTADIIEMEADKELLIYNLRYNKSLQLKRNIKDDLPRLRRSTLFSYEEEYLSEYPRQSAYSDCRYSHYQMI